MTKNIAVHNMVDRCVSAILSAEKNLLCACWLCDKRNSVSGFDTSVLDGGRLG